MVETPDKRPPAPPNNACKGTKNGIGNSNGADLQKAAQIRGRTRQNKKQHHEGPFDMLYFMKRARTVRGEIDHQKTGCHACQQERDLKPDGTPRA